MRIKKKNYIILSAYHLMDERLSLQDKGLLTVLLSGICCENEILDINKLYSLTNENDKFKQIIECAYHLIECGYIVETEDGYYAVKETPKIFDEKKKYKETTSQKHDSEEFFNQLSRYTPQYKEWRRNIMERDNFTCQICKKRGGELNVHHIKPWSKFPELRFNEDNGITLCKDCHLAIHRKKG